MTLQRGSERSETEAASGGKAVFIAWYRSPGINSLND